MAAPLLSRANYFSGADEVIKIALIGCGGRGTGAAKQVAFNFANLLQFKSAKGHSTTVSMKVSKTLD